MREEPCGVISFELTGGRDAAVRFMDSLKLANIATHVAASKTMVFTQQVIHIAR